ncbi:preprotein translocase subunit SecA [Desulfogranum mediterraneum]|uniref:preprotein translocase subunit SecA n=1 Tax=Desulfogranum mediterraneum TaxID=160661 RepID=UPI0003FA711A|nr:hypothetical protein [Desulfogranum mediterraneum]
MGRSSRRRREQQGAAVGAAERFWQRFPGYWLGRFCSRRALARQLVPEVEQHCRQYGAASAAALAREVDRLRLALYRDGFSQANVARSFALIKLHAGRSLSMSHYPSQLLGGWVMLKAMVAEMDTGEGKTLTATLPAITAALAGIPVHVVTVNDYLARRDARWMEPLYRSLGLSVAAVDHALTQEQRRRAYRADVVYCTAKELVFDYLRDYLADRGAAGPGLRAVERLCRGERQGGLLSRGLGYALVDEADSVFIDEAVTPLIISGTGSNSFEEKVYQQAMALAGECCQGTDFTLEPTGGGLCLSPSGYQRLERFAAQQGGFWAGRRQGEFLLAQALRALHLFQRDRDYLVADQVVQIIDQQSGRVLEGRSWEHGLHQLIECKEHCPLTGGREKLASITYQRFFQRYQRLSGMSGTVREVRGELWQVYGLQVVRIPPHRPGARLHLPILIFRSEEEKLAAVVRSLAVFLELGRPVLLGTPVLELSERLAADLRRQGLSCRVLNALQDAAEAEVVALAGQEGRITVATNMAGRGTDICLGEGVRERGGLHVIATEMNDSPRIDRQLFGRCGRQGDPGSCQLFVSLEDTFFRPLQEKAWGRRLLSCLPPGRPWGDRCLRIVIGLLRWYLARRGVQARRLLLEQEARLDSLLAISGRRE